MNEVVKLKKRLISIVLVTIALFFVTSCTQPTKEMEVYSFSGENEEIIINNGMIILADDGEKFVGGDLSFKGDEPTNVKEYLGKYLFEKDGQEDAILSHAGTIERDSLGIEISSELGEISSEDLFYESDLELIKESLKFSLSGKLLNGEKFEYQLDLNVNKVYGE